MPRAGGNRYALAVCLGLTVGAPTARGQGNNLAILPSSDGPPTEGDLGYRGFRLVAHAPRSILPSEVVVTKGMVTIRDSGGTHHYIDAKGLESWLLDQARRHGYGALLAGH